MGAIAYYERVLKQPQPFLQPVFTEPAVLRSLGVLEVSVGGDRRAADVTWNATDAARTVACGSFNRNTHTQRDVCDERRQKSRRRLKQRYRDFL